MLLDEFVSQFGGLGDEFLVNFPHPFLVQEGALPFDTGVEDEGRQLFCLLSESGAPLTLGRSNTNDVTIRDTNISSTHCKLIPGHAAWKLEDLGSTNGTFLNGERLAPKLPQPLRDESVLAFGPGSLFVFLEPASFLLLLRKLAGKEKTAPISLSSDTDVFDAVPLDDVSDKPAKGGDTLFLLCDPFDPVPLEVGQTIVTGRSGVHAGLVLPHPQVSRRHAEFERTGEGVFVRDLHSANGTYIGRTKVGARPMQVLPGKVVKIGDFQIVVQGPPSEIGGRTDVFAAPAKPKVFRGSLKLMPVANLLSMIEESQRTGLLKIEGGGVMGTIQFRAGRPHQAMTADGSKHLEAVLKLIHVEDGTFTIDAEAKIGERRIEKQFSEILLEDFLDA